MDQRCGCWMQNRAGNTHTQKDQAQVHRLAIQCLRRYGSTSETKERKALQLREAFLERSGARCDHLPKPAAWSNSLWWNGRGCNMQRRAKTKTNIKNRTSATEDRCEISPAMHPKDYMKLLKLVNAPWSFETQHWRLPGSQDRLSLLHVQNTASRDGSETDCQWDYNENETDVTGDWKSRNNRKYLIPSRL